eukprot:3900225-Pleurochrysis_carterae.AAC.1
MFRLITSLVQQGSEGGHETSHMRRRFGFVFEEMNGFKTRMIVEKHEQVLVTGMMRSDKWPSDVCMNKTARIGRLVKGGVVDVSRGVSRGAGSTTIETAVSEGRRRVCGNGRQRAQTCSSGVDAVAYSLCGLGRRHHANMMVSTGRVNGVAPQGAVHITIRGVAAVGHYTPFE